MRRLFASLALLCAASPAAGEADLSGFWAPTFGEVELEPEMIARLPADTALLADTGAPEFPRMEFGGLKLKPDALERARTWRPEDEMTLQRVCMPQSIVYSVQGPFPFAIEQTRDVIVFRYEYYDQVRLVFMDGRGHPPAEAPHTKMGHSVGHWEGDELVVDTTHIAAGTVTNNGLDHSDQVHMVERYRLSADGTSLLATQWFEDSAVLDNNGGRFIRWDKRPGEYVLPYECDPTFALEYTQVSEGSE
jgi:hypothetical protein